jgi:hypothetical protein
VRSANQGIRSLGHLKVLECLLTEWGVLYENHDGNCKLWKPSHGVSRVITKDVECHLVAAVEMSDASVNRLRNPGFRETTAATTSPNRLCGIPTAATSKTPSAA